MSDNLDEMCGTCFKPFEDCMCCACGEENCKQYKEGIYCEECIKFIREQD